MYRALDPYHVNIRQSSGLSDVSDGIIRRGEVSLFHCGLTKLPIFKYISGNLDINSNLLTNLNGCPIYVGGNLYCSDNLLSNLDGGPLFVYGNYFCGHNQLISWDGGPQYVKGKLICNNNRSWILHNPTNIFMGKGCSIG